MWRMIAGVVLFVAIGLLGFRFPGYWPVPLTTGALLVTGALLARPKSQLLLLSGDQMDGKDGVLVPAVWNEREISLGVERYRGNSNLLGRYIDGIVSRFVSGQDMRTMELRSKFLETFNRHAELSRESYKWQRYMKGGRAALEEDVEDMQAEIKLQQAKNELEGVKGDPELAELQKKARRMELHLEIARTEKAIAELNKPEPPPPAPPPPRPPAETREQKRAALAAREKQVRQDIRITEADPTLSEEQKMRKLNGLEAKLAEIHEEQTALL